MFCALRLLVVTRVCLGSQGFTQPPGSNEGGGDFLQIPGSSRTNDDPYPSDSVGGRAPRRRRDSVALVAQPEDTDAAGARAAPRHARGVPAVRAEDVRALDLGRPAVAAEEQVGGRGTAGGLRSTSPSSASAFWQDPQ